MPARHDALIFDLDGTLWNAAAASAAGWSEALHKLGIRREISAREIASVSGKPYQQCVEALLPELRPRDFAHALAILTQEERAVLEARGGELYGGVRQGLAALREHHRLFIVSNCQDWYLDTFFLHSGLAPLFEDAECHGRTGRSKAENIRLVVERNRLELPLYVGDTPGDEAAAAEARVPFAHVTYGFGRCDGAEAFSCFADLAEALIASSRDRASPPLA